MGGRGRGWGRGLCVQQGGGGCWRIVVIALVVPEPGALSRIAHESHEKERGWEGVTIVNGGATGPNGTTALEAESRKRILRSRQGRMERKNIFRYFTAEQYNSCISKFRA